METVQQDAGAPARQGRFGKQLRERCCWTWRKIRCHMISWEAIAGGGSRAEEAPLRRRRSSPCSRS